MAVNSILLSNMLRTFSVINVIVVLFSIFSRVLAQKIGQVEGCVNNRDPLSNEICYTLELKNAAEVNITGNDKESLSFLCFKGLELSPFYIWANPVLRLEYDEQPARLDTYYGLSLQEVRNISKQAGVSLTSLWMYFRHYGKEEISLEPFNTSCLAILTEISFQAKLRLKNPDLWYVAFLISGIIVFFSAKSWSQNAGFYYGSGVTVGVLGFLLIAIFLLTRLFPQKLKTIGSVFMVAGCSISAYFLRWILIIVTTQLAQTLIDYWQYILGYIIVTGFISFAFVYKNGPVTNQRSLNLIKWLLQFIGLVLIYNGSQIQNISVAFVILILAVYNFPVKLIFNNYNRNIWYRFFPPKRRLLTEDEYNREALEETRKAIEGLRSFCQSPECDSWKIVSSIKNPRRFAQFIEGDSWHVTDDELMDYDSGPEALPAMPDDDSDDDDSEMDFRLGSS